MIIVSGEPRSGTSLMMETLRLLGIPVWGYEQPALEKIKNIPKEDLTLEQKLRLDRSKHLNDKFWELGGIVMQGLNPSELVNAKIELDSFLIPDEEKARRLKIIDFQLNEIETHKNDAIKIIWNGLMKTDREILNNSKIIVCLRDPYHIAVSQQDLEGSVNIAAEVEGKMAFVPAKRDVSPMRYLKSASSFINWLQINEKGLDLLFIDYDDMQFNSSESINKIINFLGITPDEATVKIALANIDPNKRRSAVNLEPDTDKEEWFLVREIYDALKDRNYDVIVHSIKNYIEFQKNNLENVSWLDEETYFMITPKLYREMQTSVKLKEGMIKSKIKRENAGMICSSCPFYNRTGPNYTVNLPYDLEDINRNSVRCSKVGNVSLEICQNHWQSIQFDPKRLTED